MLKKIVLAGSAAAVVLGAGTAALATSGAAAPAAGKAAAGAATAKAPRSELKQLRRALHAQWVTRDGNDKAAFITHDAIRGEVTAVSPTSLTVKAQDGVSQTYAITAATKVHSRAAGKGKTVTIGEVHSGDRVAVLGTGTSTLTARQILDATK